jgi:isocitrate lyase
LLGLRPPPPHLELFENVINFIHEQAPRSKIGFNTSPSDSLKAV